MRPATEMSLAVTSIPADAVNVRMMGRKALVASSGAPSVDGGSLGSHSLHQEREVGWRAASRTGINAGILPDFFPAG
jgi:hypothetical protein